MMERIAAHFMCHCGEEAHIKLGEEHSTICPACRAIGRWNREDELKARTKWYKNRSPSLVEIQAFVGGCVEIVHIEGAQLLINEDGMAMELPLNKTASRMAGQAIVGPAVVLTGGAMWT